MQGQVGGGGGGGGAQLVPLICQVRNSNYSKVIKH